MTAFEITDEYVANPPEGSNGFHCRITDLIQESFLKFVDFKRYFGDASVSDAESIFTAPFAVLAHSAEADPRFVYANQFALDLFQYEWSGLIGVPSRLSAEVPDQTERQRLLEEVSRQGVVKDYAGIRVTSKEQRFVIREAVVWNVTDQEGRVIGQAAAFDDVRWLLKDRIDWTDVETFPEETPAQLELKSILQRHSLLEKLSDYGAACVSSILVQLDLPASDIDIVCCYTNRQRYLDALEELSRSYSGVFIKEGQGVVLCLFEIASRKVEIYASKEPISQQNGFCHVQVYERLVSLAGDSFCSAVRDLKERGEKTEPAVAKLLNLEGDPYEQVRLLGQKGDGELFSLLRRNGCAG